MNSHMRIDCIYEMEHRGIGVDFDMYSYKGDWFNISLYLDVVAPLCSV